MRSEPTSDGGAATVVEELDAATQLEITGPAVLGTDELIWWPVADSASNNEGYVTEEYLEPSE